MLGVKSKKNMKSFSFIITFFFCLLKLIYIILVHVSDIKWKVISCQQNEFINQVPIKVSLNLLVECNNLSATIAVKFGIYSWNTVSSNPTIICYKRKVGS